MGSEARLLNRSFLLMTVALWMSSCTSQATLLSGKQVCVVGAGPVDLFQAISLLHRDPSIQISIWERGKERPNTINAFGIGINDRMKQSLRTVPNLLEVVQSKGAGGLISRTDLTGQLLSFFAI